MREATVSFKTCGDEGTTDMIFLFPSLPEEVVASAVFEALEGLEGAAVAPVAVGAHEPLSADAVALVLPPAEVAGALGTAAHSAHVRLPAVLAGGGVEAVVHLPPRPELAGLAAAAGEGGGVRGEEGHEEEQEND